MVVTIRCKLLQCFGVPVTLSCVYKTVFGHGHPYTHEKKREIQYCRDPKSLIH